MNDPQAIASHLDDLAAYLDGEMGEKPVFGGPILDPIIAPKLDFLLDKAGIKPGNVAYEPLKLVIMTLASHYTP